MQSIVNDIIAVELTQREINLILEYGYAIGEEEAALEKFEDRKGSHKVNFDIAYLAINSSVLLGEAQTR